MQADCRWGRISFQAFNSRSVCACFDGGQITSDAGGLLLREIECGHQFIRRFSQCFPDLRDKPFVGHDFEQLMGQ